VETARSTPDTQVMSFGVTDRCQYVFA